MKKLSSLLIAVIFTMSIGAFTMPKAGALEACNEIIITNTGPNSNNEGTCTVNVTAKVTCQNNVYVLDNNSQTAATGAASAVGSTTAGAAISGDAINENSQSVKIGAECGKAEVPVTPGNGCTGSCGGGGGAGNAGAPGGVGAVASAAPVAPVTPQAGGQGAFMLPNTATPSPITAAFTAIAAAIAIAVATRLGIAAYHRVNLK